jgi:hypothetical protein
VPITTNVVGSNTAQARCTPYNIMWSSLVVTWSRSVVFPGYSGFVHQETDRHNINEILLKVVLNTIIKPNQRKQWLLQTDSKKIYWRPSPRVLTPTIIYEKFQFLSLTEIFLIYSLCVHLVCICLGIIMWVNLIKITSLTCSPYWYVTACGIRWNPTISHMQVTLCYRPMEMWSEDMKALKLKTKRLCLLRAIQLVKKRS